MKKKLMHGIECEIINTIFLLGKFERLSSDNVLVISALSDFEMNQFLDIFNTLIRSTIFSIAQL